MKEAAATGLSRRGGLLTLAAVVLASCSSPNPKLYILAMLPGKTRHGAPSAIELRAIAIAHYLERSQIVRSSEGYRLDVLSNEWWGEPLDTMMGRILVQELDQRLPGSTVYTDSGAISTPADSTIEINLQRFDLDRDGDVLLAAQIAVEGKRSVSRAVALQVRPEDATTQALVAAMSVAVAQLADTIAEMLAGTDAPDQTSEHVHRRPTGSPRHRASGTHGQ
jgi:uncharacterized lipoprotein YmbA